ncbi:MAG: STAS domain-containing protein [Planctomycetes bacterium]|nr:STAS domain-containing protein [Planctomycetota bacterium]
MPELTISRRDLEDVGITVLELAGVLDGRSTAALEKEMLDLTQRGRLKVIVHCGELTHLSSDGMGIFLSHLIKTRKQGGDIKFCNMRDEVRSVLSVLGLGKLLVVKADVEEAAAEFGTSTASDPKKQEEKLRIEVVDEGKAAVVSLFGFVDRHTIEQLDECLAKLLDETRPRIVIDCSELTYISSNGMGVFISFVSKARAQEGDIRLCNMRDIARTVVTMLGLHKLFQVFEDRETAVGSYA